MRAAALELSTDSSSLARLLGAFAEPAGRVAAARALAAALGCDALLLFAPDPELGVPLPAPGLPQTLQNAAAWRAFIDSCDRPGGCVGELPGADGVPTPARGVTAADGTCAIVTGAAAPGAELGRLLPVLPLLGALFTNERRAAAAEVRQSAAGEAATRAEALTSALQRMRLNLEGALAAAEQARMEARTHADQAEALADELQLQATQLEHQTEELETLNEALAARSAEAEAARRLADAANRAKSEFLATMSHELRTPINAIMGYAELLDMEIAGAINAEQRAHLERIRASSRHLLTLINDVLDLAKIEAGHMTVERRPADVRAAIADALALLTLEADARGVRVVDDCGVAPPRYVGDENRVRQIVVNLLSNAIKFTERGGTVTLRCGRAPHAPEPGGAADADPFTFVEVEDTGVGMTAEEAGTVFKPFVQAETGRTRSSGGSGLGLTISRQLARLMGGDLTLRSRSGHGSCFTLWLPATYTGPGDLDDSIRVRPV